VLFRRSEIVLLVYLIYVIVVAQLLPGRRRAALAVLATNAAVVAAYALLPLFEQESKSLGIARDWIALALTILCYKELGWLVPKDRTYALEQRWIQWDRRFLNRWRVKAAIESCGALFPMILELSYAVVYAMPVFGLLALYMYGRGEYSDHFLWHFFMATLPAYALFPYFPSEPPRTVFPADNLPRTTVVFRRFNLWMLGRTGIHTSVFPSAHVSSAFGVAFAMLEILPDHKEIGFALLALASSIALATVYGRYHYLVDAVAGLVISLVALVFTMLWEHL
jgi:membrane-associated phospholipid phosphatase